MHSSMKLDGIKKNRSDHIQRLVCIMRPHRMMREFGVVPIMQEVHVWMCSGFRLERHASLHNCGKRLAGMHPDVGYTKGPSPRNNRPCCFLYPSFLRPFAEPDLI